VRKRPAAANRTPSGGPRSQARKGGARAPSLCGIMMSAERMSRTQASFAALVRFSPCHCTSAGPPVLAAGWAGGSAGCNASGASRHAAPETSGRTRPWLEDAAPRGRGGGCGRGGRAEAASDRQISNNSDAAGDGSCVVAEQGVNRGAEERQEAVADESRLLSVG
jgi:hypothetical protein